MSKIRTKSKTKKEWNGIEDKQLLIHIRNNNIEKVAEMHKRTPNNIKTRLKHIAYNYHNDGKPLEEIMCLTKLDETAMNKLIEKNSEYDETKTKKLIKTVSNLVIKIKNRNLRYRDKEFDKESQKRIAELEPLMRSIVKKQESLIQYLGK